jgi:hypothetical protein
MSHGAGGMSQAFGEFRPKKSATRHLALRHCLYA